MGRGRRQAVPSIHDISTDMEQPPAFVEVLPLRRWALNTAAYDGPSAAAQQRAAYPDIQPLVVPVPQAEVHTMARQVMLAEGWAVVGDAPDDGRLEAVATTRWLRFKDDVVVRLTDVGGCTRVDMRSKSRIGRSDLGANARRVRHFLRRLAEALVERVR